MLRQVVVMRKLAIALIVIIFIAGKSLALDYKDEPYFTAYIAGSNNVEKGDAQLTLVVTNNAILKEVTYDDYIEYSFLSHHTAMLTTAYNVSLSIEGCDGIEVKTSEQYFTAVSAMKPIQIPLMLKVRDDVKAGEYTLKLKIEYSVIDHLFLDTRYYQPYSSLTKEISYEYNGTATSGNLSKTTIINETVQPVTWFNWIKYRYSTKEQTINLPIVVEKEKVKLEIVDVKADNFVASEKGRLNIMIKNTGEKVARDLFVLLSTPSGFSSLSTFTTTKISPEIMKGLLSAISPIPTKPLQLKIPDEITALLSKGTYFVGDLQPNQTANVTFTVDISANEPGYYPFQLKGVYLDAYGEVKQTPNVAFGVWLQSGPEVKVIQTNSTVYAGSKGDFRVKLNISIPVKAARLAISVKPPLSAIVSECYLGDVRGVCNATFKLKASEDAEATVYPAKLKLTYSVGDKEVSKDVDTGVKVHGKMRFRVEGTGVVPAGEDAIVSIRIKNLGSFEVKAATARITVVDPFSTTDDTAYIGKLKPGEAKNVSFKIKADRDATPKLYALNLEVKYRDPSDEWVISEPVKMPIRVVETKSIPHAAIGAIIVMAIAAAGYIYRKRGA